MVWRRSAWFLHAAVWAGLLVLYVPFFQINGLDRPVLRAGLSLALFAGFYYLNARLLVPRLLETGRRGPYLAVAGAALAVALGLALALEKWGLGGQMARVFFSPRRYVLSLAFMFGVAWLVSTYSEVLRRRRAAELQAQQRLRAHSETELQYLRAQINPHFLFNTLNNLYALALAQSPAVPAVVLRLASLLRYALDSTRQPRVALSQEVTQLRELLWLDGLRREEPADVQFDVRADEATLAANQVEPMLLLTLAENALKHGDLDYNPAGYVRLRLRLEAAALVFETRNSYDPADQTKDATPGVGLANIRQRLALTYPAGQASLTVAPGPREFVATLRLPLAGGE